MLKRVKKTDYYYENNIVAVIWKGRRIYVRQ